MHPAGLVKPDDPDAQIKFLAAETLHGIQGNRFAKELRRRDCVMGEMWKNKPPFRLALNREASDEIARHCKQCTQRGVMKIQESGTALAEGMGVPVSKMEELIAAHCQSSLKTVKDPDRGRTPRIRAVSHGVKPVARQVQGRSFITTSCRESISQHSTAAAKARSSRTKANNRQCKGTREKMSRDREREEERRGEKGREENGRKSEEKGVRKEDEKGDSKVVKDVTGWTVVTRNKRQRKMAQIFVKVNGSKATPMEVNLTDDKVEDEMRQIKKDENVYVTMHGKVLRRDEKLKSCEVTDGCTIQVTSKLRSGGKHKDKR